MKELIKSIIKNESVRDSQQEAELILEKLITLGGETYPRSGNVVILAGGAGSGKGFVTGKLLGIEGVTYDVDHIKGLALRSTELAKRVKAEFGVELKDLNLRQEKDVATLHNIMHELGINDKKLKTLYTSIAASKVKPNIIFDVTLKDLYKLSSITSAIKELGYKNENIHIVWVVNDIEVAKAQNAKRNRRVPVDILINTHRGVSQTMNDILSMGETLKKYMDGDIVLAFNKVGIDSELIKSDNGGSFIKTANYVYVKRKGKTVTSPENLSKEILQKIASYVPRAKDWI